LQLHTETKRDNQLNNTCVSIDHVFVLVVVVVEMTGGRSSSHHRVYVLTQRVTEGVRVYSITPKNTGPPPLVLQLVLLSVLCYMFASVASWWIVMGLLVLAGVVWRHSYSRVVEGMCLCCVLARES